MSELDDEREVERRYRQLPREEPPAVLDAKVRAEARRAVVAHPAPLVAPTGRRTWYFPVAAAAVIVLAVAVTWQVEREQGDEGAPLASAPAPALRKEQKLPEQAPQKQPETRQYAPLAKRAEKPAEEAKNQGPAEEAKNPAPAEAARSQAPAAAAKDQAPPASVAGTLSQSREDARGERESRMRQERPAGGIAAAPAPQGQLQRDAIQAQGRANFAEETPEKLLERIAEFRQQGRHDEADKALAEFRKRYPDYRIPEAMLEKVERR
jgi:hypothetical protein